MIERVDAAVIKLDILTLIIIRGRRSERLEMWLGQKLLVLVWVETGGCRCRIAAALMDVA